MAHEGNRRPPSHAGHRLRGRRAHYGLGLAFGDPAWGDRTLENSESPAAGAAAVVDSDKLIRLAAVVADRKTEPRNEGTELWNSLAWLSVT